MAKNSGDRKKSDGKKAKPDRMSRKKYEEELAKLQVELSHLQAWLKESGERVVVVFEGRDAAGKGGVIKRLTEKVSPRVFRVVALPAPTEREKTQLYFQRYYSHFPAGGEMVVFDRSWYNRAGVERVMGFCSEDEVRRFFEVCPQIEKYLIDSGVHLIKYFFDVGRQEQERRFLRRMKDPVRQWKLSPMDLESWARWWDYTAAYADMFNWTDTAWAPWYVVEADDKRRARLNCIAHLLDRIPYEKVAFEEPRVPRLKKRKDGVPDNPPYKHFVPERY